MSNPSPVKICAHRGASHTHPENTVSAFDQAVALGADMIEFDVQRTGDDKFIVMHDDTVDRTTDGHGRIAEMTLDAIRNLDAGRGQRVPTLDEALAYGRKVMLNIHTKIISDRDVQPMAMALAKAVTGFDIREQVFIASDHPLLLKIVRQYEPAIRLCSLIGQQQSDYVTQAVSQSPCEIIQPWHSIVTKQMVDQAHAHGLKVNVFFADDQPTTQRLISYGVDGILTNVPAQMLRWRSQALQAQS